MKNSKKNIKVICSFLVLCVLVQYAYSTKRQNNEEVLPFSIEVVNSIFEQPDYDVFKHSTYSSPFRVSDLDVLDGLILAIGSVILGAIDIFLGAVSIILWKIICFARWLIYINYQQTGNKTLAIIAAVIGFSATLAVIMMGYTWWKKRKKPRQTLSSTEEANSAS